MIRGRSLVALLGMTSALVACSFLKRPVPFDGGVDAGVDAGPIAPDAGGSSLAANQSAVTRYPDEKAVDRTTLTTEFATGLRTQAGQAGEAGDLVINLKKGTEVDKVAEHGGAYLIISEDPKDTSRKLMGWVSESAFGEAQRRHEPGVPNGVSPASSASADAGTKAPPVTHLDVRRAKDGSCPTGYKACAAACRLTCKTDAACGLATAHCDHGLCTGPGSSACK